MQSGPGTHTGCPALVSQFSDSSSLLLSNLLGRIRCLAGLGSELLGLVSLRKIAFLTSLLGTLGGSLGGFLGLVVYL